MIITGVTDVDACANITVNLLSYRSGMRVRC